MGDGQEWLQSPEALNDSNKFYPLSPIINPIEKAFNEEYFRAMLKSLPNADNVEKLLGNCLLTSSENAESKIAQNSPVISRNQKGYITEARTASGAVYKYEPGSDGQPIKIVLPDGQVWQKEENIWKNPITGETMNGTWILDNSTGDLTVKALDTKESVTFKMDGSK